MQQEVDLALRIEQGDQEAKQRLAEANLRLVVSSLNGTSAVACNS